MHQGGFGNAVATLGTAITSEHARMIARYAKVVYLAYDSDAAGQNATERAIRLLGEAGVDAKVIQMTGAKIRMSISKPTAHRLLPSCLAIRKAKSILSSTES